MTPRARGASRNTSSPSVCSVSVTLPWNRDFATTRAFAPQEIIRSTSLASRILTASKSGVRSSQSRALMSAPRETR